MSVCLVCKQVSQVQSLYSNWCAVMKSFVDIVLLPLAYLNSGTRSSCNTNGCITNGCVTNRTRCSKWENLCSDGKYSFTINYYNMDCEILLQSWVNINVFRVNLNFALNFYPLACLYPLSIRNTSIYIFHTVIPVGTLLYFSVSVKAWKHGICILKISVSLQISGACTDQH